MAWGHSESGSGREKLVPEGAFPSRDLCWVDLWNYPGEKRGAGRASPEPGFPHAVLRECRVRLSPAWRGGAVPGSPSESRARGPGEPEPPRKVSRALPPSRFQGISAGICVQDFTGLLLTPTPCLEGPYWVVTMLSCEIQSP